MARRSRRSEKYLSRCQERIDSARKFRRQEGIDDLWQRLIDLYKGRHFPEGLNDEDRIAINVAFSTINVIEPSVAINNPKITVQASSPDIDDQAVIVEAVVNYWLRKYEIKPEFRAAVKDMLILGIGFLKTGWRYVEEEVDRDEDDVESEFQTQRYQADEHAAANPGAAGELPTDDEIRASIADTHFQVTEDRPFVERVSPFDIYVDPEATSLRDARWIAQRVIRDIEDVRNDERYKASARRTVKADAELSEDYRRDRRNRDGRASRVTVWEFYDLKAGTMCVFSELCEDYLVDPVDQPYAFGHPFVMLSDYEVPEQFYPMGELEAVEDLQQELNKVRSQMMNHRKRFHRKYLYDPRAFNKTAVGKLMSDVDGEAVAVNEGVPLGEAVLPINPPQLDPMIYQESEQIERDINQISGVNEYMRGGDQEIRRTATEASIIQDAANSRAADKLAKVEAVYAIVARHLVQLAQQYMSEDAVARIEKRNGQPFWFHFKSDDIQGEFDFEVEAGSTQPQNETFRRQTAMQMLQAFGPMIQLGIINPQELVRHVLQFGFGVKDPSRFLMQGGPPGAAPPGADPNADPNAAATDAPPEPVHEDPFAQGDPAAAGGAGIQGIPPELIAQLQGQTQLPVAAA